MSALRRAARAAYTCFWHCGTCVPEALLLARTGLWWLLLLLTDDRVFAAKSIVQVLAFSTKPFWVIWCGVGPLLTLIGRLAGRRWLHGLGFLWLVGYWGGTLSVLLRITPETTIVADVAVSTLLAAWLLIRLVEAYLPRQLLPWLRRHPRSWLTKVSSYDGR